MPNDNMPSLEQEERAHALLRWSTPAPIAEFDEALGCRGFYTQVQRKRSDKALQTFDQATASRSFSELDAFLELERLGVFTQADFYSPDKAERRPRWIDPKDKSKGTKYTDTSYLDDLKAHRNKQGQINERVDRRNSDGTGNSQYTAKHQEISISDTGRVADQRSASEQRQRRYYRGISRRTFRT